VAAPVSVAAVPVAGASRPPVVPPSTTSLLWSRSLVWSAVAVESPTMFWVIIAPWSPSACADPPMDRTFALAAALMGAATFAFAATARSTGAATSSAMSRSALRSRIETTSLSGNAVAFSAASSSGLRPCSSLMVSISLWRSVGGRASTDSCVCDPYPPTSPTNTRTAH
jgi:hypothetical protein